MRRHVPAFLSVGAALLLPLTLAVADEAPPTIDQTDPEFWEMTQARVAEMSPEAYRTRAAWLLSQVTYDDTYEAIDLLKKARNFYPRDAGVLADLAFACAAPYRWTWDRDEKWIERSRALLDRARELDPDRTEVHRVAALLAMLDGDLDGATSELSAALQSSPEDDESLLLQGAVLRLQDRFHEAYAVYDQLLERRPDDWRAWSGMADVYRDDEWYKEALNLYGKAMLLHAGAFPPRFGQIAVYQRMGFHPIAHKLQQDAIDAFPHWKDLLLLNAAANNMRRGHYDAALEELDQIEMVGHHGLCRGSVEYRKGVCRRYLGDLEGAAVVLNHVVEDYPEARNGSDQAPRVIFSAARDLATVYEELGRPQDAAEVLEKVSAEAEAPLWLQLQLSSKLGDYRLYERAAAALRRGLAAETSGDRLDDRIRVRVELARALNLLGADPAEAVAALEAIDDEAREQGMAPDCLWMARGWALAGGTDHAIDWLGQAIERGWSQLDAIRSEPDLASLRSLPAYRSMLKGR